MTFQDVTHRDDIEKDLSYFNKILNGDIDNYKVRKRYFHKEGSIIWGHLTVSVVRDDKGKPDYFISQIIDITASTNNAKQRRALEKIVAKKNLTLKDFAQIASHDIRTHVGNFESLTGFLAEDFPEIKDNETFLMLNESLGNLKETLLHLEEIRVTNSIESLSLKSISLMEYVNSAIYNVMGIARKHDVNIINTIKDDVSVLAIVAYMDSVVLNFLTNAIKYRSEDRFSTIKLSSETKGDFLILKIEDNGIGIDLEKNGHRLFDLNAKFTEREDSRGMGLFITKNHIDSMGGKVEVESELGKGSCFSVYFKLA